LKKYMLVTTQTLEKLADCFSGADEYAAFSVDMEELTSELTFCLESRKRAAESQSAYLTLRQFCVFALFCREHMELIHQLIRNLDCEEISEEEMKRINAEYDDD
jgi:hypothetical protein